MIAMQYNITLPADYDMNIIRQRVKAKANFFDRFESLVFKAFLITEKSDTQITNHENQYSPFYLWKSENAMADFIMSDSFKAIPNSFGQPTINHWCGILCDLRKKNLQHAKYASIQTLKLSPFTDFANLKNQENMLGMSLIENNAFAVVSAFEPITWSLIRFCLWEDWRSKVLNSDTTCIYQVLHLSVPKDKTNNA